MSFSNGVLRRQSKVFEESGSSVHPTDFATFAVLSATTFPITLKFVPVPPDIILNLS